MIFETAKANIDSNELHSRLEKIEAMQACAGGWLKA